MQKISFISVVVALSFLVSGCLPTIFTGATVSAVELAKDRPAAEALTDMRIASAIKGSFIKNNFRELYTKIKVEVVQGRVLYTGVVDKEDLQKHRDAARTFVSEGRFEEALQSLERLRDAKTGIVTRSD